MGQNKPKAESRSLRWETKSLFQALSFVVTNIACDTFVLL